MKEFTPAEVSRFYAVQVPKVKQSGKEWRGPCPIHKGERDNFAVDPETGRAYCHSKCGRGWDIFGLQHMIGAQPFALAKSEVYRIIGRLETNCPERITAEYSYTDAEGRLLFQVIRYEGGPKGKRFSQRRPGSNGAGGWIWSTKGIQPVLYNLPKVIGADTIFVVEGEKDVATLDPWGFVATCNAGGAGKWKPGHSRQLAGKHVVVVPDNDPPGEAHALHVAESLQGIAASVRILRLPELPEKGDVTDWKEAGGTPEAFRELLARASSNPTTEIGRDEAPAEIPDGFKIEGDGLYRYLLDEKGGYKPVFLCARLEVVCRTRDGRGEEWGKLLRFKDPDGRTHQWIMPDSMLASERGEWRSHLLRLGLKISPAKDVTVHLRNFLFIAESPSRATKVDQIGWHGDVFATPAWTIPESAPERIILDDGGSGQHHYAERGSVQEWRDSVASQCAGNSLLMFAVSAAFAPILLPLRPGLGGGFHLASNTTTGKTTMLIAAGSVWGGGTKDGFAESWNSTSAGIEGMARSHNHSLLCLDEIKEIPPDKLALVAYALANGHGTARMNRDATSKNRARFELIFLSTGEMGCLTHVLSAEKRAYGGQEVRVCEIRADRGHFGSFDNLHGFSDPARFAESLVDGALKSYGTAAPEFIRRFLACGRGVVRHRLEALMQTFRERCRTSDMVPEVDRILNRFALVAAAGELASEWGVTGWLEGEAFRHVASEFENCIERRGTRGSSDLKRALEHVRAVLLQHSGARLQRHRDGKPLRDDRPVSNRLGFCGLSEGGNQEEEYQFPNRLPNELCGPYDHDLVVKALESVGALRREGRRNPKRTLPEIGRQRTWVILPSRLFADADETADLIISEEGAAGAAGGK